MTESASEVARGAPLDVPAVDEELEADVHVGDEGGEGGATCNIVDAPLPSCVSVLSARFACRSPVRSFARTLPMGTNCEYKR